MQAAVLSTPQKAHARPDLQSILPGSAALVAHLCKLAPSTLTLDVKDTMAALVLQLDEVAERRSAGEIDIDNAALCSIACDTAYLLAAMLSPWKPFDLTALPMAAQEAFDALQGQLYRLGLMDNYDQGGGVFSI